MFLAKKFSTKTFSLITTFWIVLKVVIATPSYSQGLPKIDLPKQENPPPVLSTLNSIPSSDIGPNTNLVLLLDQIRTLTKDNRLQDAQKIATTALENLNQSEQNEFYLRQIKSEETKLYFKLANQAMLNKQYAQASQYIERYRENVSEELENRKLRREIKTVIGERKDVSLVGRLVEELDQAKKDLAQMRAKSGLPTGPYSVQRIYCAKQGLILHRADMASQMTI